MEQSAIEREILAFTINLRLWIKGHDRGVLIGLLMACIPIIPVTTMGLLLCIFNKYLIKKSKLDIKENKIVIIGICISLLNLILGTLIVLFMFSTASMINWTDVLIGIKNIPLEIGSAIKDLFINNIDRNNTINYV